MYFKRAFLFLVFILLVTTAAYPAIFVVTSNADSGPGTLREALNNAASNGVTVADTITFNMPGSLPSDRTIRLKSQLPLITSKVIIDGSTQPGIAFGISGSHVILEPETTPASFNGLVITGDYTLTSITQGVEIYGMYIRNFASITNLVNYNASQGSGILIQGNASGIKIGAPGKGNVICGNINGIYNANNYYYDNPALKDITIQSNIIGLAEDGKTANANINGINISTFDNTTIGGDDAGMGNTVAACVNCIQITRSYYTNGLLPQSVIIKNNKVGTDYTGTTDYKQNSLFVSSSFIKTYGINITSANTNVSISANVISGQIGYGVFISASTYTITNNKIGTDVTGTQDLGNYEGIRSDLNATGTIGGTGSTDKNYIGHNTYGIEVLNSNQVLITQNSIFCNTGYGIAVSSNYYQVPFVQVLTFNSNTVGGIATPNSAIELFYSDDCAGSTCQGKTYFTTVQSDGSGKWSYSGAISGTVIATATNSSKNTSPFSALNLLTTEPIIKHYTCTYAGSITISQPRDGILFHWDKIEDNGTLTPIGDTQNIAQLLPGSYQLTIQYPGGCQKVTQVFEIKDQRIKIQYITLPIPGCRQKSFPISVTYQGGTGNVISKWINDQNVVVATGTPANIPAGTYTLHITDDAGCDTTSAPFTITAKPGPDYDLTNMKALPARCGFADGSITNITTTVGIGTLTYSWKNASNQEVGTDKDLTGVPSGYYTLELMDQSGDCSNYYTTPIYVGQTNSVIIGPYYATTPATCGENNGSINVPIGDISNASQFNWYGPNGSELIQYQDKLNLTALADGIYTLKATNPISGCNNSIPITVLRIQPDVFSVSYTVTPVTCGLGNNGGITLSFGKIIPQTYKWTNDSGQIVSYLKDVTNATPGKYTLTVTDQSAGCSSVLLSDIVVPDIPLLAFDASNNPTSKNDRCDQQLGSITGISVTGGIPPYNYSWTDANNRAVGGNSASLNNVGRGVYTLAITDATYCGNLKMTDSVGNDEYTPEAPVLDNQRICIPESIILYVKNPATGIYKLYENANDAEPTLTSSNGQFSLNVKQTSDYYVTYNVGSCESPRTKVHIEVVSVDISIPNTITPNGDSINDKWQITGLDKFPGTTVQVFNRFGQLVFESKDYPIPFDGTVKGKPLPSGSYYYIININIPCSLISGNLTLVR